MKLDCSSYHLAFLLFLLQAGSDVQDKVFGLIKVKLDSLDATFVDSFPSYDVWYFMMFGISTLLFWRLPWSVGFRKTAIVSLTLRSLLYFCCMISPTDSPMTFCGFLWALQGFFQGLLQAPVTGLILQQFRNTDERFTELRWTIFVFFVGIISSIMSFVSAPNVADETLCSTLITVGLLMVNILNYVVCFFPYEQIDIGMGGLRNEKSGLASGTLVQRAVGSLRDRLSEAKQFLLDSHIMSICIGLATVECVRYYMFFRLPLELYYRVLFPATPFQITFLKGACYFEIIGIVGAVILMAICNKAPFFRNLTSPFAVAFLGIVIGAPFFTTIADDVDKIEDSFGDMHYLALYIFGIALTYFARITLLGPYLLRVADSKGNIPGVLAFVRGFSFILLAVSIMLTNLFPIEGLTERGIPFAVVGGVTAFAFFLMELCCKRQAGLVSSVAYRPLTVDSVNP